MGAHARLSPSAAVRWITCPGSVSLDDPEEEDPSEFAAEGTVAHEIRAECLSLGMEPDDFVGQTMKCDGFEFTVTQEMADHLKPGIERVRAHNAARIDIEYRTDLREWIEDGFGTTDVGLVDRNQDPSLDVQGDEDLIVIDDLKYGAGVAVSPVENWQLMIYALGYWWNVARHVTNTTRFLLRIDQPRIAGAGGEWETDLEHLLDFAENVLRPGAKRALVSSKRQASEKGCRWCRIKNCAEKAAFNMELMMGKFDDETALEVVPELPRTSDLTPERRGYILKHKQQLIAWLQQLHDEAEADAKQGLPTPGQKLVMSKRPPRQWNADEKEVAAALKKAKVEPYTEPKVISVAVAEKALGKKAFNANVALKALVTQGEGKPILVDENDPAPAIESFADKFAGMTIEGEVAIEPVNLET